MKTKKKNQNLRSLMAFDQNKLDDLDWDELDDDDRNFLSMLLVPDRSLPQKHHITQDEFGRLAGIDQSVVSRLLARKILTPAMPWRFWLVQFFAYSKGVVAGRKGSGL